MSSHISVKFVLSGPLKGRTINLGSSNQFAFVKGELTVTNSPEDVALVARFLERNWQAYPEGHPALTGENGDGKRDLSKDSQRDTESEVQRNLLPGGSGSAPGGETGLGGQPAGAAPGGAGGGADGNGQPAGLNKEPEALVNEKLKRAVLGLDPTVNDNWTKDGKPSLVAVQTAYGSADVTRAAVDAVAPKFDRKAAKKAAAG